MLPPDVNVSDGGFTVDGPDIRFGLNAVKNVGRNLIATTVQERREMPFRSLYDYCKRLYGVEINRRAVESLIKAGAFDQLEDTRRGMLESVEGILKSVETDARKNVAGQLDLFSQLDDEDEWDDYHIPKVPEYPPQELLRMEKDVSGLYLSGHPLDSYREKIEQYATCQILALSGESAKEYDGRQVNLVCTVVKTKFMTTKSNTLMAFTTVEDLTGTMEILIFPKTLADCRDALQDNAVVVVSGRVSVKEEEPAKLLADHVVPIDRYTPDQQNLAKRSTVAKESPKAVYLKLPGKDSPQMAKVRSLLGILDGTIPPERERESLQIIVSETRRLSRLVRRMLDLSRLNALAEDTVTAQEQFDLTEVVSQVLISLETKITGRKLDVDVQMPDGKLMVWGDPDSITQVCYNLVDNAAKFAPEGSTITVQISKKDGKAYTTVQNLGATIPPDELPLLFDRFHKADYSRSMDREGVGLGLYIVKTILNKLKENINVTSEDGVTRFTFTLTLA